jgi:hypothetical protein
MTKVTEVSLPMADEAGRVGLSKRSPCARTRDDLGN